VFRIGTYRSRNQQEQQQQQPLPPPPPELLAPEASQPASQQHNDVNKPRINKSLATRERERERAALTKHDREKREEPGSSRVRRVQRCHRFVACRQRRNLPAGKRR